MTSKGGPIAVGVAGALGMLMVGLSVLGGAMENTDDSKPAGSSTALNADKVPPEYVDWIIRAGTTCDGVSAPLIAAQISAESNWNPNAKSPVGAQGLSQFMPGTWVSWGVDADKDGKADPFTPADAIMTQARYDCWLMKKVRSYHLDGDPTRLMLAAYNAGPGAVEQYGGIPPYIETQTYVERIMERVAQYSRIEEGDDTGGPLGQRIAAQAKRWIGTPYAWGGGGLSGPTRGIAQGAGTIGFDCSSLTQYAVYHGSGGKITLPRTSQYQAKEGTAVSRDDAQPGDLVAFSLNGGGFDHIGVVVGHGQFVHAPRTGDSVKISSLDEPYYKSRPMTIRRIG
ncbi:NlpC/P60 family protein (plasmid) [Streptomyces europaeiscabiei]|uniref:C40 family peptidase n=1 Tax=Streptomyces europaeiscabiei TaxID=146819 RepID=UPI002E8011EE|nr:NlpC/P60 family protein [Streptomyces europaeiscabiei]WUD38816.1 NlpC/P60 family protein [Streptomyces europaeiscabiei]